MDTTEQLTIPSPPETTLARAIDPRGWSRDLAILGGATSAVVPITMGAGLALAIASGIAGALLGALLGAVVPTLLHRRVRAFPVAILALAGAGLGADWGAATAGLATLAIGDRWSMWAWPWHVEVGAMVGLVQLGWFWLPAIALRARGRSTAPLVAAAVLASPLIAVLLMAT